MSDRLEGHAWNCAAIEAHDVGWATNKGERVACTCHRDEIKFTLDGLGSIPKLNPHLRAGMIEVPASMLNDAWILSDQLTGDVTAGYDKVQADQVAPTLAAYATNLAQGKEAMAHEFTHILELAAKAGVKVDEDVAHHGYRSMNNLRRDLAMLQVRHDAVMASFLRPRWRRIFDAVFR